MNIGWGIMIDQPGLRYLMKEDEGSGHKRGEAIAQKREKMRAR